MSYIAESRSVQFFAKMFENITNPVVLTNVAPIPNQVNELVDPVTGKVVEEKKLELKSKEYNKTKDVELLENQENMPASANTQEIQEFLSDTIDSERDHRIPDQTNVYKHLQQYPIVNSWIKIFHWFPTPHILRPLLMRMAYSNFLSSYTKSIDDFFDSTLDNLDVRLPQVKTLKLRDIRNVILDDPIHYIIAMASNSLSGISGVTQQVIIIPSRDTIHQLRDLRGRYIGYGGNKPLIRSYVNPILENINYQILNEVTNSNKEVIPINFVTINSNSNEFSYTFKLLNNAILESRPILHERFNTLQNTPTNTGKYIAAVFEESKEARGDGQIVIIIATLETIRIIANDGYSLVTASRFFQFLYSDPIETEKIAIAEEANIECLESSKTPQKLVTLAESENLKQS